MVKTIKKRRKIHAVFFATGMLLTVLFAAVQKTEAAIACAVACVVSLIFLYRQNRLLYLARLISDNRILTVPSSIVISEGCDKTKEETVVSTFGMLLENKVYRWGCDGMYGIRLREIKIDKEYIRLTFGTDHKKQCVELLHGMRDRQRVIEITQKLWHETGVQAKVSNW